MNYFIDAVMLSQIVVLYGLAAPRTFRMIGQACLNKNPPWLATDPALRLRYRSVRYPLVLSALVGAFWLFRAARTITGQQPADTGNGSILLLPMLSWLVLELAVAAVEYQRVWKKIPQPDLRRTTFAPRNLSAFASPLWLLPAMGMILALTAGYLMAFAHEALELHILLWRMGSLVLGCAIWACALHHAIHRKKQPVDEAIGVCYRRADVRATVACLYGFVAVAGFRALQDVFAIFLMPTLAFYAVASLSLQLLALA